MLKNVRKGYIPLITGGKQKQEHSGNPYRQRAGMAGKGIKTRAKKGTVHPRRMIPVRPLRSPVDPKTKPPSFTQLTGIREVPGQGSLKRERSREREKRKTVTPFIKGQPSWNPKGRPPNELSIAVMLREIGQEPVMDAGIKRKRMEALLRRVYQFAMLGEQWAVQFIADRTEGRPAQIVFNQLNNQNVRGGTGIMANSGGEDLSALPLEELVRLAERLGVRSEDYHLPPPPIRRNDSSMEIEVESKAGTDIDAAARRGVVSDSDTRDEEPGESDESDESEESLESIETLAVGKRGQVKGVFS